MKKLLIHLLSIRDSLHLQAEILRKQKEVEFNKRINLLVSEICSYLSKDISRISISNNRYIIWKKEIILTEKENKAFKEMISQKTDIPISAINIYKLNYNPITVIRIDLELLNLIEKSDAKDSNYS
jgi:hypothetical protein